MFCSNCGKQLPDNVRFCTGCGTPVDAPVQEAAPVQSVKPTAPKKGGKGFVLPVVVGAVVVVVALVVALLTGLFTSDKTKVLKAFDKSAKEYQATVIDLEVPQTYNEEMDILTSQSLSVWINSLPMAPEVEGMGVQLDTDVSIPDRQMQLRVTGRYGAADIISAEVLLDDAMLYADVPQITGGKPFAVNTETLGQTLVNYGVEEPEFELLGFNVYDLIQLIKDYLPTDVTYELPEEDIKAFVEALEVEKVGKKDRDINGNSLKCTVYDVVIPEKALSKLLDACIDAMPDYDDFDPTELAIAILAEIGAPEEALAEFEAEAATMSSDMDYAMDEYYEAMEILTETLGDIELEVSVHKGYVVSVYYENSVEGMDIELTVDLGGGENYADALSIEAIIDDVEMILISSGDHTGKSGVYTNVTTLEISADGEDMEFTSEMTFEPDASDENFTWLLDADMAKVEMVGSITGGKSEATVRLDKCSIWVEGEKMADVGMELSVREYQGTGMNTAGAIDLSSITMDELYEEVMAMEGTAMAWAESIMTNYPELAEMLGNL